MSWNFIGISYLEQSRKFNQVQDRNVDLRLKGGGIVPRELSVLLGAFCYHLAFIFNGFSLRGCWGLVLYFELHGVIHLGC